MYKFNNRLVIVYQFHWVQIAYCIPDLLSDCIYCKREKVQMQP